MTRRTKSESLLRFQDKRAPHEIQVVLERQMMSLFTVEKDGWRLVLRANPVVTGCRYDVSLKLDEAGPIRHYTFRSAADWSKFGPDYDSYFQNASDGWFSMWTRDMMRASPPLPSETPSPDYARLVEETLQFESHLQSAADVQREIVKRMEAGASFRTSHKEGGTTMRLIHGSFVCADYGESNEIRTFATSAEFLPYVRQYFDMEVRRCTYPKSPPELDAWKLVLRLLWGR